MARQRARRQEEANLRVGSNVSRPTYFRLKVVKKNGQVVALEGHYDNGDTDSTPATR